MEISLTKGYTAIIDDEDYELISNLKWRVSVQKRKNYHTYLTCIANTPRPNRKTVKLHRVIMAKYFDIKGKIIEHKNGNPLDCRKTNMRIATRQGNSANMQKKKPNSSSKYKGVHRADSKSKPWRAVIKFNGKQKHLGNFKTEEEAFKVYSEEHKKLFGSFSLQNSERKQIVTY